MAGIAGAEHLIHCFFTLQSSFSSTGLIRSSMLLTLCEYPAQCSLHRNRSTRSLSTAPAQPHGDSVAYCKQCIIQLCCVCRWNVFDLVMKCLVNWVQYCSTSMAKSIRRLPQNPSSKWKNTKRLFCQVISQDMSRFSFHFSYIMLECCCD